MIGFIIILQTPGNSEIKERINSMAIAPKKIASVCAGRMGDTGINFG